MIVMARMPDSVKATLSHRLEEGLYLSARTHEAGYEALPQFDGVFPAPLSAVAPINETEGHVWIAAPNGTAEQRIVTIAESRDEVLISAGLNVGDEVITEPPAELVGGTLVEPIR